MCIIDNYAQNGDIAWYFQTNRRVKMSESVSLDVTGMKCGGCETNVKKKLNTIDGVVSVEAMNKENKVIVEYESDKTSVEAISTAITEAGFVVE